jgi:hypothetical protein
MAKRSDVELCSGALNLNLRLHALMLDGVFAPTPDGRLSFQSLAHLTTLNVEEVLTTIEPLVGASAGAPRLAGAGGDAPSPARIGPPTGRAAGAGALSRTGERVQLACRADRARRPARAVGTGMSLRPAAACGSRPLMLPIVVSRAVNGRQEDYRQTYPRRASTSNRPRRAMRTSTSCQPPGSTPVGV